MSDQAKPAPTAAEIAEARKALPSAIKYLVGMGWDGYEKLAVLLAALDAAEARAVPPGAIVVSDTEETRERIARALAVSDGYASDASRELVSTFLADARAVLAALREASR